MNVVDSSGWLEYFSDGPNAKHFSSPLREAATLVVPVISIYEVFKVVLREAGDDDALQAVAAMQKGRVIELTANIAMSAARLSLHYTLPMADSVILATAKAYKCTLWTQDADFKNISDVKFFPKK
ncbi:MAG: type II toxin-antitoxin system VapC family toxin [Desulfobacterales bacterium]